MNHNIEEFIPLRQKTPPCAVGMNGEVDPAKLEERRGVWLRRDETLGKKIPRRKRSGGRGGFIQTLMDWKIIVDRMRYKPALAVA